VNTFIYILIDPVSNQIRYVGKANKPKERYRNHKNPSRDKNTHKRRWINSLKKLNLNPELEIIDEIDIKDWKYWEKFWISYYKYLGCSLINHTTGGDGLSFGNQTSFVKNKKPWNLGIPVTEETKLKIRKALTGKKQSEETKEKRRKSLIGKNTGNKSEEALEKIRPTMFKKGHTPSHKGRTGGKSKKSISVLQYTISGIFIQEFRNCTEAAKFMGCIAENIRRCCVGKSKSAKKFIWKYKNKNLINA